MRSPLYALRSHTSLVLLTRMSSGSTATCRSLLAMGANKVVEGPQFIEAASNQQLYEAFKPPRSWSDMWIHQHKECRCWPHWHRNCESGSENQCSIHLNKRLQSWLHSRPLDTIPEARRRSRGVNEPNNNRRSELGWGSNAEVLRSYHSEQLVWGYVRYLCECRGESKLVSTATPELKEQPCGSRGRLSGQLLSHNQEPNDFGTRKVVGFGQGMRATMGSLEVT